MELNIKQIFLYKIL
ncbi:hypothetical protein [Bacillus cereus]